MAIEFPDSPSSFNLAHTTGGTFMWQSGRYWRREAGWELLAQSGPIASQNVIYFTLPVEYQRFRISIEGITPTGVTVSAFTCQASMDGWATAIAANNFTLGYWAYNVGGVYGAVGDTIYIQLGAANQATSGLGYMEIEIDPGGATWLPTVKWRYGQYSSGPCICTGAGFFNLGAGGRIPSFRVIGAAAEAFRITGWSLQGLYYAD